MKQEDYEALMSRIDDISERVILHRKAIGFVADKTSDEQLMANLMMIEQGMERTENMIAVVLGQPEPHKDDVPY